jgi:hypothetical protein
VYGLLQSGVNEFTREIDLSLSIKSNKMAAEFWSAGKLVATIESHGIEIR